MKRLHVHVSVKDVGPPLRLSPTLFAAEPTMLKADGAKCFPTDPWVNFVISRRGAAATPAI